MTICSVGLTTSCRTLVEDGVETANRDLPASFSRDQGAEMSGRWWTAFGSAELDAYIAKVLEGSLSLSQAAARFEQARALAVQRGSGRIPELAFGASAAFTDRKNPATAGGDTRAEAYELGLSASYELDLWGRVRATARAASLDSDASREDLETARISVASEAVLTYLGLLNVRRKIDVLRDQVDTQRRIVELTELRYRKSQVTGAEVLGQRESLAATEAALPLLDAREIVLLNELAVLAGMPPGAGLGMRSRELPIMPPVPATGLPSELLGQRPDVRAAYLRLAGAGAGLHAAKADRLPALRISGSASYTDAKVDDLFDNWIANLAASLAGPLIDGGRRRAEVQRSRAVVDERIAGYRSAVLRALSDVEDALALEQAQTRSLGALERQLEASQRSYDLAAGRYRRGATAYLSVLAEKATVQRLERDLADARLNCLSHRVRLYRALAGCWDDGKDLK